MPFHIHHSHWLPSWAVISLLSSKPSDNIDRTEVCCQTSSHHTLSLLKGADIGIGAGCLQHGSAGLALSPVIVLFWTQLYGTWIDLQALLGSLQTHAKYIYKLKYLGFNCDLSCFWFTGAHTAHVLNVRNVAKVVWAHFNWKWPVNGVLFLVPHLHLLVWSVTAFPSSAYSVFWRSDFSTPLSSPACSLKLFYCLLCDYFSLD